MLVLFSLALFLAFDSSRIRDCSHIRVYGRLWKNRRYRAAIGLSLNFVDLNEKAY